MGQEHQSQASREECADQEEVFVAKKNSSTVPWLQEAVKKKCQQATIIKQRNKTDTFQTRVDLDCASRDVTQASHQCVSALSGAGMSQS